MAASMRNEERNVHVTISCISGAVRDASCTCPGSALGRCNHVAAVLLSLDEHWKEFGYNLQPCTSKPCEWNKGKRGNKNPRKVTDATYSSYKEKRTRLCDFDPRPASLRNTNEEKLNGFVCSLKYCTVGTGKLSMWESLFDYRYSDYEVSDERKEILWTQVSTFCKNLKEDRQQYSSDVLMIPGTEVQSASEQWKASRWFRVTASAAKQANTLGSLLKSPISDDTLRKFKNYIHTYIWDLDPYTSPDMMYGIENEDQARNDYQSLMIRKFPAVKVVKTGFWVNNAWPELGCSPDGLVLDPSESDKYGLLEIKCPQVFRTVAPVDLFRSLEQNKVKKTDLYNACFGIPISDNSLLTLKATHCYYFQIQFQLAITELNWCDFVLWSSIGTPNVERIRCDDQLIATMLGHVRSLWYKVVAPELFEMRVQES